MSKIESIINNYFQNYKIEGDRNDLTVILNDNYIIWNMINNLMKDIIKIYRKKKCSCLNKFKTDIQDNKISLSSLLDNLDNFKCKCKKNKGIFCLDTSKKIIKNKEIINCYKNSFPDKYKSMNYNKIRNEIYTNYELDLTRITYYIANIDIYHKMLISKYEKIENIIEISTYIYNNIN